MVIYSIFLVKPHKRRWKGPFKYQFEWAGYKNKSDIQKIKRIDIKLFKVTPKPLRETTNGKFYRTEIKIDSESYSETTTLMISSNGYGWVTFTLTEFIKTYLKERNNGETVFDLIIKIKPHDNIHPKIRFVASTKKTTRGLLIIFSDAYTSNFTSDPTKGLLNQILDSSKVTFRNLLPKTRVRKNLNKNLNKLEHCHRENYVVNLSTVLSHSEGELLDGLGQMNIYRCIGACDIFLGKGSSVVQTPRSKIILRDQESDGESCCSPKSLSAGHYMVSSTKGLILREVQNLKVESCHCT